MIAKLALAALMFASVPILGATQADAGSRDGHRYEYSGSKSGHDYKHHRSYKDSGYSKYRKHDRYGKRYGSKHYKYGHWGKGKRHWGRRSCYAAAKRRGGYGKRLWGIGGKAYGRHACDRAMYECRRELRHRKASGRNPFARCVIVRRG